MNNKNLFRWADVVLALLITGSGYYLFNVCGSKYNVIGFIVGFVVFVFSVDLLVCRFSHVAIYNMRKSRETTSDCVLDLVQFVIFLLITIGVSGYGVVERYLSVSLLSMYALFVMLSTYMVFWSYLSLGWPEHGERFLVIHENYIKYIRLLVTYIIVFFCNLVYGFLSVSELMSNRENFNEYALLNVAVFSIFFSIERLMSTIDKIRTEYPKSSFTSAICNGFFTVIKNHDSAKESEGKVVKVRKQPVSRCPVCNKSGCARRKNGKGDYLYLCKRYKNVNVRNKNGKFKFQYVCFEKGIYKKIK